MATGQPALARLWKHAVASYSAEPALSVPGGAPLTFAELDERAEEAAAGLRARGAEPGAGIIVSLTRGPSVPVVILGTWLAAAVAIPARADADITRLAEATRARLLIADEDDRDTARRYRISPLPPTAPARSLPLGADHAYVMATTGTAGAPKMAAITHQTSAAVMEGLRVIISMAPGEHAAHTASFVFSSSIRQMMLPLVSGARITVHGTDGRFDPGQLLDLAGTGVTSLDLTPSQVQAVLGYLELQPGAPVPESLRRLLVASEVFTPAMLLRWRAAVQTRHGIFHLYGQTETGGAISALLIPEGTPAGGVAQPPQRLPIARPFPPFSGVLSDRPGGLKELCIAGLHPRDLVLASRAGTGEHPGTDADPHGRGSAAARPTGDLFELNSDGTLSYVARADSQVKILGVRIDAGLIERRAAALPGVEHVIAVAGDRPGGGQGLYVIFTAGPGAPASLSEAVAACAVGVLGRQLPAPRVIRLDGIPLNYSGKVDRAAALRRALAQLGPPAADAGEAEALWSRYAAAPAPGSAQASADFFAAGGDSIAMIGLLAEVARRFGVRVMPGQFHADPTLAGLKQMIAEGQRAAAQEPAARQPAATQRPATAAQRGIWISEKLHASDPLRYWLTAVLETSADLDYARLAAALRTTMARFDILRCRFTEHDGDLIVVPEAHPAATAALDNPGAPGRRAMDSGGRLIRVAAARAGTQSRIEISVHHAAADRRSLQIILSELAHSYARPGDRPRPAASFLDAMPLLQPTARDLDEATTFWSLSLPRAPQMPLLPGTLQIEWLHARRGPVAPAGGATRHAVLLWAFRQALEAAGMPQPELIGVDVDLRPPGAADAVGPYVQALPVILPGCGPVPDGPQRAMAAISGMLAHARVPLSSLRPPVPRPTGDPRQPFYRYKLVYQAVPYPALNLAGQPTRYLATPPGIAENSVTLFARDEGDALALDLAWDTRAAGEQAARTLMTGLTARELPHDGGTP